MDIQVFIEKFAEAIEVEDTKKLSENTEFRDLDEWSSLRCSLRSLKKRLAVRRC